ncbi:MAG: response regulator [Prochloraceae cyanobacterium]
MEQLDPYFVEEATEMLQVIEEKLVMLLEEKTTDRVHTLLRSAHTLKGSAASMGLDTIHTIAHHLEDVFEALYPPELEIDPELGSLLLDGYECISYPLRATLSGMSYDEEEALNKTASVFALLQDKLGDFFGRETPMPSSSELGFDVVGSIFRDSVPKDLQILEEAIASNEANKIATVLRSQGNFFLNIGASYQLPGLEEIAQNILTAIERHPEDILEIGALAYDNLQAARNKVLAGDRTRGGEVSPELRFLAGEISPQPFKPELEAQPEEIIALEEITLEEEKSGAEGILNHTANSETTQKAEPEAKVISSSIIQPRSPSQNAKSPLDRLLQSIDIGDPQKSLRSPDAYFSNLQPTPAPPPTQDDRASASIKVAVERLDNLTQTMGELLSQENQRNAETEGIYRLAKEALKQFSNCQRQLRKIDEWCDRHLLLSEYRQQPSKKSLLANKNPPDSRKINTFTKIAVNNINSQFDSLEMDAYTDLHLLVRAMSENMLALGERVETIEAAMSKSVFGNTKRKQLINGARDNLLDSRMVAAKVLFNRFDRLLERMVATNYKQAKLKLIGTEVLIDKAICDRLYEPLLHLIRNAYDHGIEEIEVRQKLGKPESGQITLEAYHQGNLTTIEVKDDGKGLDWEKIRTKAIEQEILDRKEAESLSVAQLAEVLFEPGFSTSTKITDLSGRGIGLDVVRTQLQQLDGSISIRSVAGVGTNFILQLPLKVTTARLPICKSQNIIYATIARTIAQIILPKSDRIVRQNSLSGQGYQSFLLWQKDNREMLVPIFALSDLINYQCPLYYEANNPALSRRKQATHRPNPLLLLENDGELFCLQVDEILSEQELVIKTFSSAPNLPSYVQGYSVLDDGNLTLVIDPSELLSKVDLKVVVPKMTSLEATLSTLEPEPQEQLALLAAAPVDSLTASKRVFARSDLTILVVEDSAFQRRNVVTILTEAGYQVLQASDGQQAIAILERHPEVKLTICDIEMPVMNGFEFLEQCRLDPRFANIPVVMLTSRSNAKHRKAAYTLGAKGYYTKPCTPRELLETIEDSIYLE